MLRGLKFPSRKLLSSVLALSLASALSTACFKSLDESLLDGASGGSGAGGSGGTAGSSGSGGTAGSSGSGGGGTGGQDAGGDANDAGDADAAIPVTLEPWDSTRFPSTDIAGGATNGLISVDGNFVYWVEEDGIAKSVSKHELVGGNTTSASDGTVDRASALSSPAIGSWIFVGVGVQATDEGRLVRFDKVPAGANPAVELPYASSTIGHIVGMTLTSESPPRLIVVAKTSAKNQPHILATSIAGGGSALDLVYTDPDGNQTGGPIASDDHCIYWLSNGRAYAVPLGGGSRVDALTNQVTDASGIATDGSKVYVARANGEVWQRNVLNATCDGSGPAETRILSGFTGAKELVSYANRLGFIAANSDLGEGGVFSYELGSTTLQQVVPASKNATKLRQVGSTFVFRTTSGVISKVPDGTQ